tara:strand:+ start:205 stop:630 length:426 start_codon:yes stop_codon:yes gene_type:complete
MSTIVLRETKGSPLTHTEVDANFTNLNNDKAGYIAGQGGTQTQATSKSTEVILNDKKCGTITMNNEEMTANQIKFFTFTNNQIAATDIVVLNHASGGTAGKYVLNAAAAAGSAVITVTNISTGSLSEAIVIRFAVVKAAIT